MAGPSDTEQLLLEYVNDTRLDPLGSASRYISSYAPLTSPDSAIASALQWFGVSGTALQAAYQALTPAQPLAWNENLATSARTHDQAMITAQVQSHQVTGELDLGARATAAGYLNWTRVGENVYAYASSALHAHAGFMVDWGSGPNGMQSPAGHRDNIVNGLYKEIGIAVIAETTSANPLGPLVISQEFGTRSGSGSFLLGVAYTDRDGNGFYSTGEGRGDLQVAVGGTNVVSYASGGYQLATTTAARTAVLSGGGLSGNVSVQLRSGADNVKVDVINGNELHVSGSATISGPVSIVEAINTAGQSLAVVGTSTYRLSGASGNDSLTGGDGHDIIQGGAGADTILGGSGNDHLYGQSTAAGPDGADWLMGGDGIDYLQGNAGNDTLEGGAGVDRLYGGADDDRLDGGASNDMLTGARGNDTLSGGLDNDLLRGGKGNDLVSGDAGDDVLIGGQNDDTLVGGTGRDTMTGADGTDLFRFAAGDAAYAASGGGALLADQVVDFVHGVDHIALGFGVTAVLTGSAQTSAAGAAAYAQSLLDGHAGTGEVAAVAVGADTWLFYNGLGGGVIDSAVRLSALTPSGVTTTDFV